MTDRYPYQRFVIVCTARTGSTMLRCYLNSHPDILCMGAVYDRKDEIKPEKFHPYFPETPCPNALVEKRREDPVGFLESYVYRLFPAAYKAVGFKYFYYNGRNLRNGDALIDYFVTNADIKFIHLKRRNLMAALFSHKRALTQSRWKIADAGFQIEMDISECEIFLDYTVRQQATFDDLFGDRSLQVVYEDLDKRRHGILADVQRFIGVSSAELRAGTVKNSNAELSSAIVNWKDLKEHFRNSRWHDYFHEHEAGQ